jgi:chromosome segregation ATPase
VQESRIEELRDTHRLEGTSQTDLIAKLRTQLSTAESNLASKASELLTLGQLRSDLTKAQTTAKEEEEKRTKAISLLKTVRMKLVKAEKDKEEAEKDRAEERAERSRAGEEVERVKAEREREVNALRKGFERELASARERYEKDLQTKKAAWELEMITTKVRGSNADNLLSSGWKADSISGSPRKRAVQQGDNGERARSDRAGTQ